jgi:hypothetical protein
MCDTMVLPTTKGTIMTLLENIDFALQIADEVRALRAELVADPSLAEGDYWRDRLESKGYEISSLLSTEDD